MRIELVKRPIDPAALLREVASPSRGATSLFLGTVRDTNAGLDVTGIEYSAYETMAQVQLQRIVDEAEERFDSPVIVIEHRLGVLALGDISIGIAAAHRNRGNALDAARFVIEEVKRRVPIWKLEHYVDGTREWVDPTRPARPLAGTTRALAVPSSNATRDAMQQPSGTMASRREPAPSSRHHE
jgi:molybdopterin synthase catalytic subunit